MTTEVVIDCAERECNGTHDEDGDCDLPDCDPRCTGHFGQPTECVLCPDPRCYDHTYGTCALCDEPYCIGHYEEEGMYCEFGHASWCDNEEEGTLCNPGNSCELDLGMGVWLTTEISDASTSIGFRDWRVDKDTWGLIDTGEKAEAFEVIFARARSLLVAELEYASRFRQAEEDADDAGDGS